jgi:hypothetical protein
VLTEKRLAEAHRATHSKSGKPDPVHAQAYASVINRLSTTSLTSAQGQGQTKISSSLTSQGQGSSADVEGHGQAAGEAVLAATSALPTSTLPLATKVSRESVERGASRRQEKQSEAGKMKGE